MASYFGLIPREYSRGGRHRLGGISKQGKPAGIGIAPFIAAIWRYLVASLLASGIASVII